MCSHVHSVVRTYLGWEQYDSWELRHPVLCECLLFFQQPYGMEWKMSVSQGEREGEWEERRVRGREGGRKRGIGREGKREGGRKKEGGREGKRGIGREGKREGKREGGREGGRERGDTKGHKVVESNWRRDTIKGFSKEIKKVSSEGKKGKGREETNDGNRDRYSTLTMRGAMSDKSLDRRIGGLGGALLVHSWHVLQTDWHLLPHSHSHSLPHWNCLAHADLRL